LGGKPSKKVSFLFLYFTLQIQSLSLSVISKFKFSKSHLRSRSPKQKLWVPSPIFSMLVREEKVISISIHKIIKSEESIVIGVMFPFAKKCTIVVI
jgi:hypothetical protein